MTPKEQEIAIGELEERVDRLRALYEQYFLGFEKLEPSVPRKDVDRRFAILRKQQIRNTALRFRFSVLTQKFNTYQMYWVRICRQIEEGTFKRHVRRANERFGKARSAAEADISIDVDLADFELDDMDAALAEANAAAEAYSESKHDTDRPPAPAPQPIRRIPAITVPEDTLAELDALAAAAKAELPLHVGGPRVNATSWVNTNRQRESFDEAPPSEPPHAGPPSDRGRAAPLASLPAGAKPRILRKIGGESTPAGSMPAPQGAARIIRVGTPGAVQPGAPSHSSGRLPVAPAHSSGRLPAAPPATSSNRLPAAPPASSSPLLPPNARPPQGSQPHLPPMRPPQGSQPHHPPMRPPQGSQPGQPPPAARPPPSNQGQVPAARPPQSSPQGSNPQGLPPMRPPQGTQPNLPPMRPQQGTAPNLPPMRPAQGSQPNVRPRTPSMVDGEERPRVRPQLPSQVSKTAPKKEGDEP